MLLTSRPRPSIGFAIALAATFAMIAACATTGSTVGSGVADRELERPPYYAGSTVASSLRVGHLPIVYQVGGSGGAIFEPASGPGTPMAGLLTDMNRFLDSLAVTVPLQRSGDRRGIAPDVEFGCETDATGDCIPREEGVLGRDGHRLRLAVRRPSAEWVAWSSEAAEQGGVDATLVLTVELGQFWIRQRGLRGDKEVELGTNNTVPLPWLTSLETPVTVVQLTGALVGRDGRAIRIGAEGMTARRTRLLVSGIGGQELIRAEDIERLRTTRRTDLRDRPFLWEAALREMLAELTGNTALRPR